MIKGVERRKEQEIQLDWAKIDGSNYCSGYRKWKTNLGREKYWDEKGTSSEEKEQWARLRCGNVGKAGNKGYKDTTCRICGGSRRKRDAHMGLSRARCKNR